MVDFLSTSSLPPSLLTTSSSPRADNALHIPNYHLIGFWLFSFLPYLPLVRLLRFFFLSLWLLSLLPYTYISLYAYATPLWLFPLPSLSSSVLWCYVGPDFPLPALLPALPHWPVFNPSSLPPSPAFPKLSHALINSLLMPGSLEAWPASKGREGGREDKWLQYT